MQTRADLEMSYLANRQKASCRGGVAAAATADEATSSTGCRKGDALASRGALDEACSVTTARGRADRGMEAAAVSARNSAAAVKSQRTELAAAAADAEEYG